MEDRRQPFGHIRIPMIRLAGDATQHVPRYVNAELARPFQELQIYQRRVSLGYEAEQVVVEALDAGLNPAYACLGQNPDLLTLEVRLCLIKKEVPVLGGSELRQHGFEKRHVEDVVNELNAPDPITPGELG